MDPEPAFWIGGRVPVRNRVLAAPMCGASKLPYRLQARRFGADVVYTEMVKAKPLVRDDLKTLRLLGTAAEEAPCAAQVCGAEPARMARASAKLEALGFPLIDLNMGCPVKKIVREGAGSALLKDPARIEALVKACVAAVDAPVTVKVRSGWAHQGHQDVATIARAAEAGGAALITIHARSREQRHDGPVDTEALAAAKQAVAIPVVANGGITRAADALTLLAESGCDAVMIGRGAHGQPWLFRDVARALRGEPPLPPPTPAVRLALMREHFEGLLALLGDHGVQLFRKHARWYFHSRPEAPEFVERLYRSREPEAVRGLFAAWEDLPELVPGG
ncbi:MAG: tRNA dihydrouridine synthase DusB [Planctomycetota bacterium]